jgi:hypothetical protein
MTKQKLVHLLIIMLMLAIAVTLYFGFSYYQALQTIEIARLLKC